MRKIIILFVLLCLANVPIIVYGKDEYNDFIPNAVSGVLIEADSGKIIFEKNKNEKLSIASMTKMVAQIIILEQVEQGKIKWDDVVTVSKNAQDMGGSQIYISEGEKISVRDLMKGISMASGNDATVAMAEYISGSEAKFVELMNAKIKELGLKNTVFKNSTGLDEDGHYSSAYDMGIIARELVMNHPDILKFSSVYEDYLRENTPNKFWLVNTNKLVRFYDGVDGLKTGHTDNAGYCLAATAKKNGLRLIAIVLGETNATVRNKETMDLLNYGYQTLKTKKLKSAGEVIKKIKLDKADSEIVEVVLKNDLFVVENIDDFDKKYDFSIDITNVKLPLKRNDVVGKLVVYDGTRKIKKVDLVVNKNVKELSFFKVFINEIFDLISGDFL